MIIAVRPAFDTVLLTVIGGLAVLLIAYLGHSIVRWLARVHKAVESVETKVAPIAPRVARIEKQVTPNGGDTDAIGDRVQRCEKNIAELTRMIRSLMTSLGYTPDGRSTR